MSAAANVAPGHGADVVQGAGSATYTRLRAFHTLDALRGVAAIAVVMFHAHYILAIPMLPEGQIAVDLFFVMSGFIIAYRYDQDFARGLSLASFFKIRLIRLYPLFLLGTLLGAVPAILAIAAGKGSPLYHGALASFPLAIVMLPSWLGLPWLDELYPLNYVSWSLAPEILVNLVYAATFRFWTVPRILAVMGLAFVGLCGCEAVWGTLHLGFVWGNAPGGVVRILYGFPAGVLLYRLYARRPFAIRIPWWLIVAAATCLFCFVPPFGRQIWEVVAVTLIVPMIVVAAVANEPPPMLRGACALAGVASYLVYSLHAPLMGFFVRGEERLHMLDAPQTATGAFAFLVLLLALCVVAHLCWDKPIRRALMRLDRVGPSRAPAVATIMPRR